MPPTQPEGSQAREEISGPAEDKTAHLNDDEKDNNSSPNQPPQSSDTLELEAKSDKTDDQASIGLIPQDRTEENDNTNDKSDESPDQNDSLGPNAEPRNTYADLNSQKLKRKADEAPGGGKLKKSKKPPPRLLEHLGRFKKKDAVEKQL